MTKRIYGTGSLYKRAGSRIWYMQFSDNGQIVRETTGEEIKRRAAEVLQRRIQQAREGVAPDKGVTVAEMVEAVLRDYRIRAFRSLDDAEARWKLHLKPYFGLWPAQRVNRDSLSQYIEKRQQERAKNATINRELALLKRAFSLAERNTKFFPSKLEENNTRTGFITDAQADKLAAECGKEGLWMRALFAVLYDCGFRIGEALALRVGQVDLAGRMIRLNPGETKSGHGRTAPLTAGTLALLDTLCTDRPANALVFTREDGKAVRDFRVAWAKATEAAGVPDLLVHDLRRSAVRRMMARGISQHIAMQISGHRTVSVFHRYAIVSEADLLDAARKLEGKIDSHLDTQQVAEAGKKQGKPN